MDDIKIYCPKCSWIPDGKPYWQCSCGMKWDTFSTGARCPSCDKVWGFTQCVETSLGGCHSVSPHLDWYHGLDGIVEQLKEQIRESWLITKNI